MFLSLAELKSLTGRVRYSAQLRWLLANGFSVLRDADGKPLVLRSAVEARMGDVVTHRARSTAPNWKALDAPTKAA